MAKKPLKKAAGGAGKSTTSNLKLIGGLILFAVVVFSMPTAIVLGVGLLPTFGAVLIDRYPEKYIIRCVGAMNIAGVTPYLLRLWGNTNSISEAIDIVTDSFAWLVMYGAAGIGWMIYLGLPGVVTAYIVLTSEQRITSQRSRQENLVAKWGLPITGQTEEK